MREPNEDFLQGPSGNQFGEQIASLVLFCLTSLSLAYCYMTWWAVGTASFRDAWVFTGSFMFFLVSHEYGHYSTAKRRGFGVSLPMFIPFPFAIGTLGAVISYKQRPPARRDALEMALVGPVYGVLAIVLMLCVSVGLTDGSFATNTETTPWLVAVFGGHHSDLLGSRSVLDAAWLGCLVTTSNLFPIKGLDGGRLVWALNIDEGLCRRLSIGILAVMGAVYWSGWLIWLVVVVLMPDADNSVRNPEVRLGFRVSLGASLVYVGLIVACFPLNPGVLPAGLVLIGIW